jgi:uncharacterized protein YgiM (DUF1202 family)
MKRSLIFVLVVAAILMSIVAGPAPANAAGAAATAPTSTVVAARLRVREAPNVHAKTLAIVKRGDTLTILGKDAARPHWLKVQTTAGVTGWVWLGWVRLQRGLLIKTIAVTS